MEEQQRVKRDSGEVRSSRAALIKQLCADVDAAKAYWKDDFDRMRDDMEFARGKQWANHGGINDRNKYVANITLRHIKQNVASLYARNPKMKASIRDRIDYQVWDGSLAQVQAAQQTIQRATMLMQEAGYNPLAAEMLMAMDLQTPQAILAELEEHTNRRAMLKKMAETLVLMHDYYVAEQVVPYKSNMKRAVRMATTAGVAYVKLDFQRLMRLRPDAERKIADFAERLANAKRLANDAADGEIHESDPEMERLQASITALSQSEMEILREGLVWDFPQPTSIIPDTRCTRLDGFVGCDWVAQEYYLTPEEIQEIYGVDVKQEAKTQTETDNDKAEVKQTAMDGLRIYQRGKEGSEEARVLEIFNRKDGVVYVICEGWGDFLQEPVAPNIKLERFWPIFALTFNECEHEDEVYPPSDVRLIRDQQKEYNRSREGLREHRQAARPGHVVAAGVLDADDRLKMENRAPHDVVEVMGLQPGQNVQQLLQQFPTAPIDPNLYEVNPSFVDIMRTVGSQEANLGGTSGATATESAIAEGSRTTSNESSVDDLDEFLSQLARAGSQVMLMEVSEQTVKKIVGAGAVWPTLTREQIAEELFLEVEAGSTGRPNRTQELQNFERILPFLIQLPGIKPVWLAEQLIKRLDDNIDLTDAMDEGQPSIVSANRMAQPGTGNAASDPTMQGGEGYDNAEEAAGSEGGKPRPGRPPMGPISENNIGGAIAALP